MNRRVVLILMASITTLAGVLRWHQLGVPSLWLDEILHLRITRELDWSRPFRLLGGLREARGYSENGVLYYAFQALGLRFASGDLGVRLAPALVGTLTVPVFGWIAGGFASARDRAPVALTAAFVLAVSPLHVVYSREGRPYYLLMALAVVLLGVLVRSVRSEPLSRRDVVAIALLVLAGVYVGLHALPLYASAMGLAVLLLVPSLRRSVPEAQARSRSNLLVALGLFALGAALCGALYLGDSRHNVPTRELREEQKRIVESPTFDAPLTALTARRVAASLTTAGNPSLHVGERALLMGLLAVVGLLWLLVDRGRADERASRRRLALIAAGMFVLPAVSSFAALVWTGRWYHVRYTSPALPAFLLLVALGVVAAASLGARLGRRVLPRVPSSWVRTTVVVAVSAVAVLPNVGPALADPHDRLDWRAMADRLDDMVLPGEPIVVSTDWPIVCLGHYFEQIERDVEFIKIWQRSDYGQAVVDERPRGWLLSAGVRQSDDARRWMRGFLPILEDDREAFALFYFPGIADLLTTHSERPRGPFVEDYFESRGKRFDFDGTEKLLLGVGWSVPESSPKLDYRWAVGREAHLGLPIGSPRDVEIELRLRPYAVPDGPPPEVEFWLGDRRLESPDLRPDWNQIRILVPKQVWQEQPHVLRMVFGSTSGSLAGDADAAGERDLAAIFDWLRIAETRSP